MNNFDSGVIAVGIPTFRRPNGLARLLTELAKSDYAGEVEVFIADNDLAEQQGAAVATQLVTDGYRFPINLVEVSKNGISEARNALIDATLGRNEIVLLCMLDDDEWPSSGWLRIMAESFSSTGADILGGHVIREFDIQMPQELMDFNTIARRYPDSGMKPSLEATSNIAFKLDWLRSWRSHFFDPAYSKTGGEDKELLLRMKLKGASFFWSNEAFVHESFPASRSTREWALQRAYRVGNSEMIAYINVKPPFFKIKELAKIIIAMCTLLMSYTIFSGSPVLRFRGRVAAERARGKIGAIFGHRHFEYTKVHGN